MVHRDCQTMSSSTTANLKHESKGHILPIVQCCLHLIYGAFTYGC